MFETGGVAAEAGAYPSYNRAEAGYVLDGFYAIYCKKNVQFFYVLWVKTLHKLKYNTHGITGLRAVVGLYDYLLPLTNGNAFKLYLYD